MSKIEYISSDEAAKRIGGITGRTVRLYAAQGKFGECRHFSQKRIPVDGVQKFMNSGKSRRKARGKQ